MHRCFYIEEIVHLICGHCVRHGPMPELAALARTCRAFQEPALRQLWYELSGLMPLVKCMPEDLWKVENNTLTFRRTITASDWPRFEANARRVRRFDFNNNAPELGITDYQTLNIAARGQILLPNIKSLHLNYLHPHAFPFFRLFMGQNLEAISIASGPSQSRFMQLTFLSKLVGRYPSLKHASMAMDPTQDAVAGEVALVSAAVTRWGQLRHLSVNSLTPQAYSHVATLPQLHFLSLTPSESATNDAILTLPPENSTTFPSLQKLAIKCPRISFCTSIVNMMSSSPSLQTLDFQVLGIFGASEWLSLLTALESKCNHSSVRTITISYGGKHALEARQLDTSVITAGHLWPLFAFANLTTVRLVPFGGLDLDDNAVKEIAIAWPRIVNLTLGGRVMHYRRPRVTFTGLVSLAEYCPHLESLGITFDARIPYQAGTDPGIRFKALTFLNVLYSPIESPAEVAVSLSNICSGKAFTLSSDWNGSSELNAMWLEAERRLHTTLDSKEMD